MYDFWEGWVFWVLVDLVVVEVVVDLDFVVG
jgi:hypothetical protein